MADWYVDPGGVARRNPEGEPSNNEPGGEKADPSVGHEILMVMGIIGALIVGLAMLGRALLPDIRVRRTPMGWELDQAAINRVKARRQFKRQLEYLQKGGASPSRMADRMGYMRLAELAVKTGDRTKIQQASEYLRLAVSHVPMLRSHRTE